MTNSNWVLFLDVETTINGVELGPHPMHPSNKIVMVGFSWMELRGELSGAVVLSGEGGIEGLTRNIAAIPATDSVTIVGHNLAFDLKAISKQSSAFKDYILQPHVKIWDTMVAEYILTGQDGSPLDLESVCQRYSIPFTKDPVITAAFAAGKGADTIDRIQLAKYLKQDVECLPQLLEKQLVKCREQGQLDLMQVRMLARKALIMAEFHGMAVDVNVVKEALPKMHDKMLLLEYALKARFSDGVVLDLTAPKQLGTYLFGGSVPYTVRQIEGLYKNGKVKWKNVVKEKTIEPALIAHEDKSTNADRLEKLANASSTPAIVKDIVKSVLEYRDLAKQVSVYADSIITHNIEGKIHANINCTITRTARLSSSKPNLHNISNSPLKAAFVSRYDDKGVLLELDFSQLEIIALAVLSEDTRLLEDVLEGVDIHSALYHDMYHAAPSKAERKAFKPRVFSLIYGAGPTGIANAAGISIAEAKKFIKTFYTRYKGVAKWHEHLLAESTSGIAVPVPGKYPSCTFKHVSPTTLRLTYESDEKGRFSPTTLVNYPVQSFAADLVMVVVGAVFEGLQRNFPNALLVNVVHDSIVIDCPYTDAKEVISFVRGIMEDAPAYVERLLGFDMSPIDKMEIGVTIGENWYNMEEYK